MFKPRAYKSGSAEKFLKKMGVDSAEKYQVMQINIGDENEVKTLSQENHFNSRMRFVWAFKFYHEKVEVIVSSRATILFPPDEVLERCEDIMNDVAHELMIEELKQYLPTNNP